jgi:hypothetical protein
MRETRSSGSVEGVMRNRDPYSDSILWRVFGKLFRGFRAARERHADDLSEDEFFDQQRRSQREG